MQPLRQSGDRRRGQAFELQEIYHIKKLISFDIKTLVWIYYKTIFHKAYEMKWNLTRTEGEHVKIFVQIWKEVRKLKTSLRDVVDHIVTFYSVMKKMEMQTSFKNRCIVVTGKIKGMASDCKDSVLYQILNIAGDELVKKVIEYVDDLEKDDFFKVGMDANMFIMGRILKNSGAYSEDLQRLRDGEKNEIMLILQPWRISKG